MIVAKIKAQLHALRPSERRVAELVLAQPFLVSGASIRTIAAAAGASEPTVIRFCRAIGCVGVQDLKQQLARDLGRRSPFQHVSVEPGNSVFLLADAMLERASDTLQDLRSTLDPASLAKAVGVLAGSERVLLWGYDAAGRMAEAAAAVWFRDGVAAAAAGDLQLQQAQARAADARSAVLLLSAAGPRDAATEALSAPAESARANGAKLIGLLPLGSALLDLCTVALPLRFISLTLQPDPGVSRLPALMLLDILRVSVALERQRRHEPEPPRP